MPYASKSTNATCEKLVWGKMKPRLAFPTPHTPTRETTHPPSIVIVIHVTIPRPEHDDGIPPPHRPVPTRPLEVTARVDPPPRELPNPIRRARRPQIERPKDELALARDSGLVQARYDEMTAVDFARRETEARREGSYHARRDVGDPNGVRVVDGDGEEVEFAARAGNERGQLAS